MKKLFVYRVKSNKIWNVLKIKYFQMLGYQVYIWGEHDLPIQNLTPIVFPSAINSVNYEHASRALSAKYFEKFANFWSGNIFRLDYVRKSIDIGALDYFAFEKTISKLINPDDDVKKLIPSLLGAIHANAKPSKNYGLFLYYPLSIVKLTLIFCRDLWFCVTSKASITVPSILYLRKKVQPDNGECSYFCSALNDDSTNSILGMYPFSGKQEKKFGFYFFSSFRGSTYRLIKSYWSSLLQSFDDMNFYFRNGVDNSIFGQCITDTFVAKNVVSLPSSIIMGVLVDKPLHILMAKYKDENIKIMSMNESFFFPPNRSFDFNHLDQYFSMNDIDEKMQNKYGGNIKSFEQVEFFRQGGNQSKGISSDLSKVLAAFKYKIVIAPAQVFVEETGFYYWAYDEMESFLKASLALAVNFPDTLFIVKGKKGELRCLPEWFQNLEKLSSNIFVIHCDKPKELEYNRFEDLIDVSDLMVSMALTSTTIWQSIARNKPAIAINRTDSPSSLAAHKGYECDLSGLYERILYWRMLTSEEIYESTENMKEIFNIGKCNGLAQVVSNLQKHLNLM